MLKLWWVPVLLLVAGCASTRVITQPCDVLVKMTPKQDTARYVRANDPPFFKQVAGHQERRKLYKCK